jgi:Putative DNA-binding domain
MDPEAQNSGPTNEELARWVRTSSENDYVDAKGPMTWDGADASASLAKDIAAFANSRDGGVIVVGKSEADDGSFSYDGLSPEQAASFDTTKVGQWVNSRFAPPIRLACHQVEVSGGRFVVITVQEFDDVPSLCIKSFQDTRNPKNHLLREGTIYVRNHNAESKPIESVDELRAVIGLATRKKGDELIAHFSAMLKGRSLANLGPAPDPFEQEIEQLQSDLKLNEERGGWWMSFRPAKHAGDRWSTPEELEHLIAKHSVHIYDEFPGHQRGKFPMGWGIANDLYGETWALTKSGLFCCWKEFEENGVTAERTGYRGGDEAKRPIPPGEWVEYTWAIRTVVDFFMFMSRFVEAYGPGEGVHISFKIGPLAGRKLVALSRDITLGYGAPEPCRAPFFSFDRTIDAETLRSSWEQACAEVLKRLVELFPNRRISQETLLKWVEKYKSRGF